MNKSFWLPSSADCLTDGEMGYNSSSIIEPKRGHLWSMDASEPELFSNKRKAVESFNNVPVAVSSMNVSRWENNSSLQKVSGKYNRLSGSDPVRTINRFDMNTHSLGFGNMNMGRRHFGNYYRNECSVGLSMPREIEVPLPSLNHFDFKKFKFIEVCDPSNGMPVSMGHSFSKGDNNAIPMGPFYNKNDNSATLLAPHAPIFNKPGENLSSQGYLSNKGDGTFKLMGQCFNKGNVDFISMGQPYGKNHGHIVSMDCTNDKAHANFTLTDSNYNSVNDEHIRLMGRTYDRADTGIASKCAIYDKAVYNIPSMGQNCHKGEKGTLSFRGFINEPEVNSYGNIISSNNVLINPSSAQDLIESNAGRIVKSSPIAGSKTNVSAQNKKVPAHNFPANVKILLSTGIFDGVLVKYVSWKRDKNLRGVIEGAAYVCFCKECNQTKTLNAFEFESHAGFKTKHPNKNIYFANGKSVYVVAQELKNTPPEKLFEAIENITSSPINQKNYRSWKESFQAANRELQRIYGKNEVTMPSEK